MPFAGAAREQTRARYPDREGSVERDGVRVFYEEYGSAADAPTILFLPTWSIVHSRLWKAQVAYFARHFHVLTFDGRGNGRSDRPNHPAAYEPDEFAQDALAVMDATQTGTATIVAMSLGGQPGLILAGDHPDRVDAVVFVAAHVRLEDDATQQEEWLAAFETPRDTYEGWDKNNRHYWAKDFRGWLEFFFGEALVEPHSTKQLEDCVGWGLETTPDVLITTMGTVGLVPARSRALCERVRCPVLVVHGRHDHIVPHASGEALAAALDAPLMTVDGAGHLIQARDPVKFNLAVRDFADRRPRVPPRSWSRSMQRPKRALYVSSPIGLGHAQRDVAIADELRRLHPDLQIDWLAQHPVTKVLEARGERIHPASVHLANESAHIESESAEHDLHCFQAVRRMDEILVANFMLFHDVVTDDPYDLWIGDEAWELDHFLHENPELKSSAYVWLTDFVGWLPMADGGDHEVALTTDYNAEMIGHIDRYPKLRDRAIFVGDPDDIVPGRFGSGLPEIRGWTEDHYQFAGYITGFDPAEFADRDALRTELGYRPDEAVCIVSVGGSGVGAHLLRRVIAAFPEAKRRLPELRMVVVCGPRIDPASLGEHGGLEVRAYVPDLYRHLAACDLAVVQGGLTTAMELTANRRPFLYFPLRHHFEQQVHVRHRLERYGAGRAMDFDRDGPEQIAAAIVEEIRRPVDYRPVDPDGARRAAVAIAELL